MMEPTSLIRLQQVVKFYGGQKVLDIDSLTLEARTSVLLHGRNASGKSTLLRILGGISRTDSGQIFYHPILKRRRLSFLPQAGGLYSDLSLADNLDLRRRLYGLSKKAGYDRWYIEELGLGRFLNRPIFQLSGGFQRLAAIAATLHCEPHWLLMDEPLSGVDAGAKEVLKAHFSTLVRRLDLFVVTSPVPTSDFETDRKLVVREGSVK